MLLLARMDLLKLESLKNKQEHAQSAIASQEVRQHLAGFIRSKLQGSANQINIQTSSGSIADTCCCYGIAQANCTGAKTCESHHLINSLGGQPPYDNHPLRKTASLPSIHIPHKAQSVSRRRQLERRTTLSPLTRKNSRTKRQLIDSQNPNCLSEYSSNPCIMGKTRRSSRSLSQSNSPPLPLLRKSRGLKKAKDRTSKASSTIILTYNNNFMISSASTTSQVFNTPPVNQLSTEPASSTSIQPIKLSSIYTDEELESLKHNSVYFPAALNYSTTNLQQSISINNVSATTSSQSIGNIHNDSQVNMVRQKQHLKVNEAIRKKITEKRAPTESRISSGGSLDIESGLTAGGIGGKGGSSSRSFGNEPRQWSLDAADLRMNADLYNATGTVFNTDLYSTGLRMATTRDAATIKRLQTPVSSILMGQSGKRQVAPPSASIHQAPVSRELAQSYRVSGTSSNVNVVQCPLSSLTSDAKSQQEPSNSTIAIDLSSSSEANRKNLHSSMGLTSGSNSQELQPRFYPLLDRSIIPTHSYHNLLQESFNQLQLCKSQDGLNQYLSSTRQQPALSQHHIIDMGESSNVSFNRHPPLLVEASEPASFDALNYQQDLLFSLSKQHNLSDSVEDLMTSQDYQNIINQLDQLDQQPQPQLYKNPSQYLFGQIPKSGKQISSHQHKQDDLNQLMETYKNIVQPSEGQRSGDILPVNKSNLSEANRSSQSTQIAAQQQKQRIPPYNYMMDSDRSGDINKRNKTNSLVYNQNLQIAQVQGTDREFNRATSPVIVSEISMILDEPKKSINQQNQIMYCMEVNEGTSEQQNAVSVKFEPNNQMGESTALAGVGGGEGEGSNDLTVEMIIDSADDKILSKKNKNKTKQVTFSENIPTRSQSVSVPSVTNRSDLAIKFNYIPLNPLVQVDFHYIYDPVFNKNSSTGLVYDLNMCDHKCTCGDENNHPENSYRVLAIWRRLHVTGLMARCYKIDNRYATFDELRLCHGDTYAYYFGRGTFERLRLNIDLSDLPIDGLTQLECGGHGLDIDTVWNENETPFAARLAAGYVIESAVKVAKGKLQNAFAVVRPPGHHAEYQQAMGFCVFNSVSIAARVLLSRRVSRVLIVDWDVHHGNGIQNMFYDDKKVMYISLHRYDRGNFFPGTGNINEIGSGRGEGYNWNIAWSGESMGDAEYIAAFRCIVMPIARAFNPSMVLVACGFDAARGHPFNFGGYNLSPACFAHMTRQLMTLAKGRLVLCLEGGYQMSAVTDCAEACLRALLNESQLFPVEDVSENELKRKPYKSASETLHAVANLAVKYWPNVEIWRNTINRSAVLSACPLSSTS